MFGNLGETLGVTPIFVVQDLRARPLLARDPRDARQPARVAHAELRRAQHQERVLEARRMGAVEIQVLRHQPVRADLDFGLVVDVERGEARLAAAP